MRTRLRLLSLFLLVGIAAPAWADTDTSTTTLTIAPSATSGTTIQASDENNRNGDVTTWANAHVHTLPNTTSFGTGSAGNKSLCANAADSTDACIRWNDTANLWTVDNPTPGTFNQVATISGTSGLTSGSIVTGNGIGSLTTITAGSNGQMLKMGASSPSFTGTNIIQLTRTAVAGSGAATSSSFGFKPNAVWAFCSDNAAADYASVGFGDSAADEGLISTDGNAVAWADSSTLFISVGPAADVMTAVLTSINSDNTITVTWTKNGSGRDVDCQLLGI